MFIWQPPLVCNPPNRTGYSPLGPSRDFQSDSSKDSRPRIQTNVCNHKVLGATMNAHNKSPAECDLCVIGRV